MLCSDCNKNNAEIFINKIENGVSSMEGLCRDCAKKRGIDIPDTPPKSNSNKDNQNTKNNSQSNVPPITNIDMSSMSKQLETLFKDLSSNLKMENLDLTSVQSDAFIATLRNTGITASQLKDCLQLSQSTTAGIIARLENKRLITNFYIYI